MLDHNLVLKSDELYLVGTIATDGSGEPATGLYLRDTRHLDRFYVTLNGVRTDRLAARHHGATRATVTTTNPTLNLFEGTVVLPQRIMLEEQVTLDDSLRVTFVLQNFSRDTLDLRLAMEFSSDFRDLFDIRGYSRSLRGEALPPSVRHGEVVIGYRGLDGGIVETAIRSDRAPRLTVRSSTEPPPSNLAPLAPGMDPPTWEWQEATAPVIAMAHEVTLAPGERWNCSVAVEPRPATGPTVAPATAHVEHGGWITTSNPFFDRVMARCVADLRVLKTRFPQGSLPAAGIPWYVAPFGRDSLITGLQTLHLDPDSAVSTLRVLGALQGSAIDQRREEEPGKILHEMRYGEMARIGAIPHSPYYGTVDATPLWLWLFAEAVTWTGSRALYDQLLPHANRALDWIAEFGDLDGDGLIEYRTDRASSGGISHQVWKDSGDSLHHRDGTPAQGCITPVEVQGYLYAAYSRLADVADAFGEAERSADFRGRAETVREAVESRFWLDDDGTYAQALVNGDTPVRTPSSNPGHLLAAGLPCPERANRLIERLRQPDLDSGWGIRTLAAGTISYNPMSYHNGSVWPHDNSLIAMGCMRYGRADVAHAIASSLFDAARTQPLDRLPELFCGFPRSPIDREDTPVPYPVSCSPQAWAAGALPLIVRGMLGLEVDLVDRSVVVVPDLPAWLESVTIHDLAVLGCRCNLYVEREGTGYRIEASEIPLRQRAELELEVG